MTSNSYWEKMTPKQRSEEMSRRRAKSSRPAGGYYYVDKAKLSEYGKLGAIKRWSRNAPVPSENQDPAEVQEPAEI